MRLEPALRMVSNLAKLKRSNAYGNAEPSFSAKVLLKVEKLDLGSTLGGSKIEKANLFGVGFSVCVAMTITDSILVDILKTPEPPDSALCPLFHVGVLGFLSVTIRSNSVSIRPRT